MTIVRRTDPAAARKACVRGARRLLSPSYGLGSRKRKPRTGREGRKSRTNSATVVQGRAAHPSPRPRVTHAGQDPSAKWISEPEQQRKTPGPPAQGGRAETRVSSEPTERLGLRKRGPRDRWGREPTPRHIGRKSRKACGRKSREEKRVQKGPPPRGRKSRKRRPGRSL